MIDIKGKDLFIDLLSNYDNNYDNKCKNCFEIGFKT